MSKKKKTEVTPKRSKYEKSYKKAIEENGDKKWRTCLKCLCEFESAGPGNRRCQDCKSAELEQCSEKEPVRVFPMDKKGTNLYDGS